MNESKRLHRGDPPRVGPIRNFKNLYYQSDEATHDADKENHASNKRTHKAPQGDQPPESLGLAYRVIDRHINAGRKGAQQFSKDTPHLGQASRPLQELIDRMLRSQAEMLPLWLDLFGSLSRVDSFRAADPAKPKPQAARNNPQGNKVLIEVISSRPVEISLSLDESSIDAPLATAGLYSLDSKKPPLTDVHLVAGKGRMGGKLSIKIPDRQPGGLYSGVVIDSKSGETRGTISVRVANKPPGSSARQR